MRERHKREQNTILTYPRQCDCQNPCKECPQQDVMAPDLWKALGCFHGPLTEMGRKCLQSLQGELCFFFFCFLIFEIELWLSLSWWVRVWLWCMCMDEGVDVVYVRVCVLVWVCVVVVCVAARR